MEKDILLPLKRLHGFLHNYPIYKKERNVRLRIGVWLWKKEVAKRIIRLLAFWY